MPSCQAPSSSKYTAAYKLTASSLLVVLCRVTTLLLYSLLEYAVNNNVRTNMWRSVEKVEV